MFPQGMNHFPVLRICVLSHVVKVKQELVFGQQMSLKIRITDLADPACRSPNVRERTGRI